MLSPGGSGQIGQASKSPLPCFSRLDAQPGPFRNLLFSKDESPGRPGRVGALGLGSDLGHSVHGQQGWVEARCLESSVPYALPVLPSRGLGHTDRFRPIFHLLLGPSWKQPGPLAGPVDSQDPWLG